MPSGPKTCTTTRVRVFARAQTSMTASSYQNTISCGHALRICIRYACITLQDHSQANKGPEHTSRCKRVLATHFSTKPHNFELNKKTDTNRTPLISKHSSTAVGQCRPAQTCPHGSCNQKHFTLSAPKRRYTLTQEEHNLQLNNHHRVFNEKNNTRITQPMCHHIQNVELATTFSVQRGPDRLEHREPSSGMEDGRGPRRSGT